MNHQRVYSVNIPFSKEVSPTKPGSATGTKNKERLQNPSEAPLSKSHADTFMSKSTRNSVTGHGDLDTFAARQKNAATIAQSSVKMKFPENSSYA